MAMAWFGCHDTVLAKHGVVGCQECLSFRLVGGVVYIAQELDLLDCGWEMLEQHEMVTLDVI